MAIDSATPLDDAGSSGNFMLNSMDSFGGFGGPVRAYGRMYGGPDSDDVSIDYMDTLLEFVLLRKCGKMIEKK